jgi:hypothetical protein
VLDFRTDMIHTKRSTSGVESRRAPNPHREVGAMKATSSVHVWREWSTRYEGRKQTAIVHRPFSDHTLEQLNYADWCGAPEIR